METSASKRTTSFDDPQYTALIIRATLTFLENFFPKTFAKRIIAAILLSTGIPVKDITSLLGMGKSTVYDLGKSLRSANSSKDIVCLFHMKLGCGRKPKTIDIFDEIKQEIEGGFFTCLREIQAMIQNKYHIVLSVASTQRLIIRLGIKRLKSASLPANANPSLQEQFYQNVLQPLMKRAQTNEMHLLFMDGAHFVIGCEFLGYVYGTLRRFVRSHSGRQRYNVLGALDYQTKKVHTVSNTTYITAIQVIEMLRKLAVFYGNQKPIRVVLDNARYQKCAAVQAAMEELKRNYDIGLVYLPSYSPNLNLVERIWRFVKAEVRSSFTKDFTSFCSRIDAAIASTTESARDRINALIGEKIQLYSSLIPVDAHTFVMPPKGKKKAS